MRTYSVGDTLLVTEFENLGAVNAGLFRDYLRASLKPEHRVVEVDLSHASFVDSEGLGALISAHKAMAERGGIVRIKGALPMVRELLRLTRLNELFTFDPI
jgi:anti-sigma B factor antagonist